MPFLSRRSVDPLHPMAPFKDRGSPQDQSDLSQTPRSRARSEASILRRVSTLFTARRRTIPKASSSSSQTRTSPTGIEYRHTFARTHFPRISSDTTPQSSLEIRRPSGLGRRASLLGSDTSASLADSESFGRGVREADAAPIGFASLPNLLGGASHILPQRSYSRLVPKRRTTSFALPDAIFRVVLGFLPRQDLAVVALVSHWFCLAARYALYHSLDAWTMAESSLEKLCNVLACTKELAALVVSFHCHCESASSDGHLSSVPSSNVRQALQNTYNLKTLTLPSFASILSLTPSLVFSLTHLTILDKKLTQSQLVALRSWLATQTCLESLSFPRLVEYANADPSFIDQWVPVADSLQTDDHDSFTPLLPGLRSLRAPTEMVSMLHLATNHPIQCLTLDVRETLYTGLRPSSVIRPLSGVREMHIIFAPEVDKRTVEKFLGVTGSMLTGEDKPEVMKSLEVEVSWTDDDAAETLYGIVTSIISRFQGLETLKLTSPFRSFQAPIPTPNRLSLLNAPSPTSSPSTASFDPPPIYATAPGGTVRTEFVACGVEKNYAKTWTRFCPSLSNIRFDFTYSTADADVELCGVWFRRRIPLSLPSTT